MVTAADDYLADVFIAEDTVTSIAATLDIPADHVLGAARCYLLPGQVGPHTHLGFKLGSTNTSDDYESGTVAAAFGGSATVINFAQQQRGQHLRAAVDNGLLAAEGKVVIEVLVRRALAQGRTNPSWHGRTRPEVAEAEATNRAIALAEIAYSPVYFVLQSCAEALAEVTSARDRVCLNGQKTIGADDYSKIPNGSPGIEHRLQLLYSRGVAGARLSLRRLVDVFAATPARLFGLYPRKGTIVVGSDVDFMVFDPAGSTTISTETHHMNVGYSLYEGWRLTGVVRTVIAAGRAIVDNGVSIGKPGAGRYLTPDASGQL